MTRLWDTGDPITVITSASPATGASDEAPIRFTWKGQAHPVAHISRVWRVDIDWWRERVWRTYYKLSTDTGLLVIIYHDLITNQWCLQRLYD